MEGIEFGPTSGRVSNRSIRLTAINADPCAFRMTMRNGFSVETVKSRIDDRSRGAVHAWKSLIPAAADLRLL